MSTDHPLHDLLLKSTAVWSRRDAILAPALMGLGMTTGMGGIALAADNTAPLPKGPPVRGGVYNRALTNDIPNFNTLANNASRVITVIGPCYNGLVRYDSLEPDKIVLDLAESYEVSPDGLAYTFQLRKGIKFHDGKPCTSEDVKFTFDTLRNPPTGVVSMRSNLFDAVQSIITPTPTTVRFLLTRRSPSLLANLASGWMIIMPKHILEKGPMTDTIVGTGPFKLKENKRGVSIELVRNPDYHLPNQPYLDGMKFYIIPDDNTAWAYFRTGQLDEYAPMGAMAEDRMKELAGKAYLLAGLSTGSSAISFNTQVKPYDDIRVRKAICLAINRQESLNTVLRGQGNATLGVSLPGKWALPKAQLEKIPGFGPFKESNIAEAKALLAAAGFPNGFQENMLVQRIPVYQGHAIYIKDQLLKIGIDINIDFQESPKYLESMKARRFKIEAGGAPFLVNDPDSMYINSVKCDGTLNYSKLCDKRIEELVDLQSQELDDKKRIALVHELESRVLAQYGTYRFYFRNVSRLYQSNLHGAAMHPNLDNATRMDDLWKSKRA
jgi:peptide/nickel transport system substrate-binding protein